MSENYADLSYSDVDLSDNYVNLLDFNVDLSNIMIITNNWQLVARKLHWQQHIDFSLSMLLFSNKSTFRSDRLTCYLTSRQDMDIACFAGQQLILTPPWDKHCKPTRSSSKSKHSVTPKLILRSQRKFKFKHRYKNNYWEIQCCTLLDYYARILKVCKK